MSDYWIDAAQTIYAMHRQRAALSGTLNSGAVATSAGYRRQFRQLGRVPIVAANVRQPSIAVQGAELQNNDQLSST